MEINNNLNQNITKTLQNFLGKHKQNYFIIGGHAAAFNLSLQNLPFRATRDYDIVLVYEVINEEFARELTNLLTVGQYKIKVKSDGVKRNAYRFENPKDSSFPEIIEFFVKDGVCMQSLDNRFAKLDVVIDNNSISAMVLNEEIYNFAKRHVVEINDLIFSDKYSLIALKAFAYFENEKLYKNKKVNKGDYEKHLRDILRILSSFFASSENFIFSLSINFAISTIFSQWSPTLSISFTV